MYSIRLSQTPTISTIFQNRQQELTYLLEIQYNISSWSVDFNETRNFLFHCLKMFKAI